MFLSQFKITIFFIICILCAACNNTQQKAQTELVSTISLDENNTEKEIENTISDWGYLPIIVHSQVYNTISKGKHIIKSTDIRFVESVDNVIDIHPLRDTSSLKHENHWMYLANEEPIALFNTKNPKGKDDMVGIFNGGSLVEVDTIFYQKIYNDSDHAPMTFEEWYTLIDNESFEAYPLTYDVWYAIRINGKTYYTDYKLHNYIELQIPIPSKRQLFLLCSQATGYDGGYDRGYPDYYEAIVFQQPEKSGGAWKQIYRSRKLDLNNGGADEYGLDLALAYQDSLLDSNGDLLIDIENYFKLTWNGKDLSVIWNEEYLKNKH